MEWAMTVLAGSWIVVLMVVGAWARACRHREPGPDVEQVIASHAETIDDEWAEADREDMAWLWPK